MNSNRKGFKDLKTLGKKLATVIVKYKMGKGTVALKDCFWWNCFWINMELN